MADQVKLNALSKFRDWGHAAAVELTKSGGLGDKFHGLVVELFKDMADDSSKEDVLLAFDLACKEAEEGAKAILEEVYGPGTTLTAEWPSFRQYKSRYKAMIETSGGKFDITKFDTLRKVRAEVNRIQKAKEEAMKGEGGSDSKTLDLKNLSANARKAIAEAVENLRSLPVNAQEGIAYGFRNRSFSALKGGKPKTAATGAAGGSGQNSSKAA